MKIGGADRRRQPVVPRRLEERASGRTGFAHLFEHLMFEGSEHSQRGYFTPLQQAGALLNGSTNTDRTNYWEGRADRARSSWRCGWSRIAWGTCCRR
jgi:hypothetical protein